MLHGILSHPNPSGCYEVAKAHWPSPNQHDASIIQLVICKRNNLCPFILLIGSLSLFLSCLVIRNPLLEYDRENKSTWRKYHCGPFKKNLKNSHSNFKKDEKLALMLIYNHLMQNNFSRNSLILEINNLWSSRQFRFSIILIIHLKHHNTNVNVSNFANDTGVFRLATVK